MIFYNKRYVWVLQCFCILSTYHDIQIDYLDHYNVLEDGYNIYRNPEEDLFAPELCILMWTLDLTAADATDKASSKPRKAALNPQDRDSVRFLGVLCDILRARLDQYSTSLKDDEQLARALEQTPPGDVSDYRKTMALHVRIGEKQILYDALIKTSNAHAEAMSIHLN